MLCHLASPITYFKSAVRDARSAKVAQNLSWFLGVGVSLTSGGSLRLLRSSHVRSRDKGLPRGILSGRGVERISSRPTSRRSCSLSILWGSCWGWSSFLGVLLHSLWSKFVKIPEFHDLVQRDKSNWPRCLLWQWLAASYWLILVVARPWAETPEDIVTNRLEGDVLRGWVPAQGMEGGLTASRVPRYPSLR